MLVVVVLFVLVLANAASQSVAIAMGYGANSDVKGKFAFVMLEVLEMAMQEEVLKQAWFILVSDTTDATLDIRYN